MVLVLAIKQVKDQRKKNDEELQLESEVDQIIADSKTKGADKCKNK